MWSFVCKAKLLNLVIEPEGEQAVLTFRDWKIFYQYARHNAELTQPHPDQVHHPIMVIFCLFCWDSCFTLLFITSFSIMFSQRLFTKVCKKSNLGNRKCESNKSFLCMKISIAIFSFGVINKAYSRFHPGIPNSLGGLWPQPFYWAWASYCCQFFSMVTHPNMASWKICPAAGVYLEFSHCSLLLILYLSSPMFWSTGWYYPIIIYSSRLTGSKMT